MKFLVVIMAACLAVVPAKPLRSGKESNPLHEVALEEPIDDVFKVIVDAILDHIWQHTYGVEYDGVQLSEVQDEKIPVHALEEAVVDVTKTFVNAILGPIAGSEYVTQYNDVPNTAEEIPIYIMESIVEEVIKKIVGEVLDRVLERKQYGEEEGVQSAVSPYEDGIPVNKLEGIIADVAKNVFEAIFGDFFADDYSRIALRTNDDDVEARNIFDLIVTVASALLH